MPSAYLSVFKVKAAVKYLSPRHRGMIRVNEDGCVYRKLPWTPWLRIAEPAEGVHPSEIIRRHQEIMLSLPPYFRGHYYFPPMHRLERWALEGKSQTPSYVWAPSDGCAQDGSPAWTHFFGLDRWAEISRQSSDGSSALPESAEPASPLAPRRRRRRAPDPRPPRE